MYPIASAVKALFEAENDQVLRITGIDRNGAVIRITDADVLLDSFNIDRYSCNGEKLEVGTAVAAEMSLRLNNSDGAFDNIVFEGTELFVEIGVADWTQENPTVHYIPVGYFTPDEQPRKMTTISLKALDRMVRFDSIALPLSSVPWTTNEGEEITNESLETIFFQVGIGFPTTVEDLVQTLCAECNVPLAESISGLPNANFTLSEFPSIQQDITMRALIQWCAGIMGTNAWIDWNGELRFSWYNNATDYVSTIENRYSSDIYENDIAITGVVYTNTQNVTIVSGSDDYALDMTGNYLAAAGIAEILPNVRDAVSGLSYRAFEASAISAPWLWPMDVISFVDKDGNDHTCVLTNVAFGLNGATVLAGKGETQQSNKGKKPVGVTKEQSLLIESATQVAKDLDKSLDQEGIFNRLTDNGAAQGVMLYNGQLYVNASYIRSGTLVLGGLNNQNGTLRVVNANGEVVGTWTKDGVTIDKGTIHIPNTSDARSYVEITGGVLPFKSVKYDENSSLYTRVNVATYGLDVGRFQDGSNTSLASTMIQGSAVYVTTNSSDNTARYEVTDNYNHRGGTYGTDHVGLYSDAVSWFLLQHANYQYNDTGKNRMWMRGDVQIVGNLSASNLPAFPLSEANGGTGQTSIQATRNAMGLGDTTGALPVANGGTGATDAAGARANLGAVNKAGDTMTGNLTVQGSMYPKVILSPTYNSTANSAQFEGSYQGSASMQAWQDTAGNNRRVLEVRTRGYQSSLDNALALRDCVSGSWSTYRVFHEGMTTAVPVNKGGTGATTAAAARQNLGIRSGTKVVTLTDGSASVPFSDFGVTSRPDALILTPQSATGIMRYDWDNSSSAVVLRYQNADGSTYSGLLRFGWVCV